MTHVRRGNTMLTVRDVAGFLNVDISTVRRWTNKGILKAYRVGPRGDRRFRQKDIDLFLIEQPVKSQTGVFEKDGGGKLGNASMKALQGIRRNIT